MAFDKKRLALAEENYSKDEVSCSHLESKKVKKQGKDKVKEQKEKVAKIDEV